MTRGRHPFVIGARPPRSRRSTIAGLAALSLAVAACSTGSEGGAVDAAPTFARANGSSLAVEEPVANIADLVGPSGENAPWTIVGSVYDPDTRASVATVWTSEKGGDWEGTPVKPASVGTGETMAAAIATDEGLVAVGQVGDGAAADAVVWRQLDGEWHQLRPDAMAGGHEQWAADIASGEGGMLVAGGENVWGEMRPRLWFSADGETWSSVDGGPGGPVDGPGEESVRDVEAVGSGFVAVGWRTIGNEQDAAVWFSPDGESWEAVDDPELGGPGRQALLTVALSDGVVVAGGYVDDLAGQGQPAVWRSADGRDWNPPKGGLPMTDRRTAASDRAMRSISVTENGLVAAGGDDWRPHLWTSADTGVTWKEMPNPVHGELFEDGVDLRDAVTADDVTVAIGSEPAVLLLAGRRWEDATGDAFPNGGTRPVANAVAGTDDVVLAAGGLRTAPTGEDRETFSGHLWRRGARGWEALASETLAAGQVLDVTTFKGGFAAVGVENFGLAEERTVVSDSTPDGLVWVSGNGREWARIGVQDARINTEYLEYLDNPRPEQAAAVAAMEAEAPPVSAAPAGGDGTRSLSAVAPLGSGFIAVGSVYYRGDADPIVIRSPDGRSFEGETPVHSGGGTQRYNDVCVAPDKTSVAVGITGTNGAYDAAVATRDASGVWTVAEHKGFGGEGSQQAWACAASDEGFVVVGSDDRSGNTDARVWLSEDGLTWEEIDSGVLGGAGDQRATAAAAVPDDGGWLVAGSDLTSGDGDVALWRVTSSGEISRRDRGEPALGGPGDQAVSGIMIDDDGKVTLVGDDYGRAGLWESDTLDR